MLTASNEPTKTFINISVVRLRRYIDEYQTECDLFVKPKNDWYNTQNSTVTSMSSLAFA